MSTYYEPRTAPSALCVLTSKKKTYEVGTIIYYPYVKDEVIEAQNRLNDFPQGHTGHSSRASVTPMQSSFQPL